MKKFFALMLVAAMLSAASAAMAASPSITVSPSTVSVAAAGSATATLTATAGHNGQFGAYTVTGVDWAVVLGNTVTFAPDASVTPGSYTATVTVTETYTDGPAGHGAIATETATATIPVTVTKANAGTYTVTKIVETVTVVTKSVTVISKTVQGSTVVQTFTETIRTVAQTITTAVLTQVEGYTPELAGYWSEQTTTIETARSTTVAAIESNPATKAAIFPGLSATAVVTPRPNTSLVAATSSVSTTTTVEVKLAAATDALGGAGKALSQQEAAMAMEDGIYSFIMTFGNGLFNTEIQGYNGLQDRGDSSSGSFAAAAVDNTGVAFLNSKGEKTNVIPGYENSKDIMPGYVTMLVVMEAGKVYEPVVYATEAALKANNISVDATPVSVDVQQVSTKTVTEVVTVDESGNTTVTEIEEAPSAAVTAMKAVMGDNLVMVPADKYMDVAQATIATDDTEAAYQNLHVAARTSGFNNLDPGTYYTPITFQQLASGSAIKSGATFTFYPDGVTDGTTSYVRVFDSTGAEVTNPASMVASADTKGYMAFAIDADGVRDADGDSSLANPTLTLEMTEIISSDVVLSYLEGVGYVSGTTIQSSGFAVDSVRFSENVTSGTVKLNFNVDPSSWKVVVKGYESEPITLSSSFSGSATSIGSITSTSESEATITLVPSEIATGTRAVTISVRPVMGASVARQDVSGSVGNVVGTKAGQAPGEIGVGSSSGGCSAGSAVLALALLGAFIARKK